MNQLCIPPDRFVPDKDLRHRSCARPGRKPDARIGGISDVHFLELKALAREKLFRCRAVAAVACGKYSNVGHGRTVPRPTRSLRRSAEFSNEPQSERRHDDSSMPAENFPMLRAQLRKVGRVLLLVGCSGLVVGALLYGSTELAARCQCHYTAVMFAERQGMVPLRKKVRILPERRRQVASFLEERGAFVDPSWNAGGDELIVYVSPKGKAEVSRVLHELEDRASAR